MEKCKAHSVPDQSGTPHCRAPYTRTVHGRIVARRCVAARPRVPCRCRGVAKIARRSVTLDRSTRCHTTGQRCRLLSEFLVALSSYMYLDTVHSHIYTYIIKLYQSENVIEIVERNTVGTRCCCPGGYTSVLLDVLRAPVFIFTLCIPGWFCWLLTARLLDHTTHSEHARRRLSLQTTRDRTQAPRA